LEKFKIFFSNRSVDQEQVDALQKKLTSLLPELPFEDVSKGVPFHDDWKAPASEILETCDALVCVVGPETFNSEPVDWEIREAKKLAKPLVVARMQESHLAPPSCTDLHIPIKTWEVTELAGEIAGLLVSKALFLRHDWSTGGPDVDHIWKQYNLMVQSWEALISRRQGVNTLYVSASAALLAGVGGITSAIGKADPRGLFAGAILLSFLGAALTFNWRRTIGSYGTLSTAKSKVVGALELYLPAQVFDTEWKVLEAKRYSSTTETDKQTAQFFMLLFVAIGAVSIGALVGEFL